MNGFRTEQSGAGDVTRYLSVEAHGEDGVGVAVVADFRSFLEVIDVHATRHQVAHHHHQAAGEQTLHYVDVRILGWNVKQHVPELKQGFELQLTAY